MGERQKFDVIWESNSEPVLSSTFDALPHQTGHRAPEDELHTTIEQNKRKCCRINVPLTCTHIFTIQKKKQMLRDIGLET